MRSHAGARQSLEAMQASLRHIDIRALGYRDDMFQLMQVADAIVGRPGIMHHLRSHHGGMPLNPQHSAESCPRMDHRQYLRSAVSPPVGSKAADLTAHPTAVRLPQELAALKQKMIALRPNRQPADIPNYLVDLARD